MLLTPTYWHLLDAMKILKQCNNFEKAEYAGNDFACRRIMQLVFFIFKNCPIYSELICGSNSQRVILICQPDLQIATKLFTDLLTELQIECHDYSSDSLGGTISMGAAFFFLLLVPC